MQSEPISLTMQLWRDPGCNSFCVKVTAIETAEEVSLKEGIFLLRFAFDEERKLQRCYIRHVSSGRETYLHGNAKLLEFIRECLLVLPRETNNSLPLE